MRRGYSREDGIFEGVGGMNQGIMGRVAIVKTTSKGLSRAVAEELAREGAHVAICAQTVETLRRNSREHRESHRT
jgi:NAD(P)-dependent dehydrogenase (short-subunit alcohol dehydrogenase family)